jgi:hypothetical protein
MLTKYGSQFMLGSPPAAKNANAIPRKFASPKGFCLQMRLAATCDETCAVACLLLHKGTRAQTISHRRIECSVWYSLSACYDVSSSSSSHRLQLLLWGPRSVSSRVFFRVWFSYLPMPQGKIPPRKNWVFPNMRDPFQKNQYSFMVF